MTDNQMTAFESSSVPAIQSEELTIGQLVARVAKVREAMRSVMIPGVDLITVPGIKNPVAGKSCAEKLCMLFMLSPTFDLRETIDAEGHLEVISTCTLTHIPTGRIIANGQGSCSSRESKYRYRSAERLCPLCGTANIRKSKEDGKGFYCWQKIGGCGKTFAEKDPAIIGQQLGKVENPDIADTWNTVRKMAQKRSYVGTTLMGVGASDLATQDLEENAPTETQGHPPEDMQPRATAQAEPRPNTTSVFLNPGENVVRVLGVEVSTGTNAKTGKQWTRYGVSASLDGAEADVLSTFSDTLGGVAKTLVDKDAIVLVESRVVGDKTYLDLKSIRAA